MYHSFDVDIATDYGIPEAIFLCNIYFWVKQNTLNKHNYFEGRYWTYNSLSAYTGLFPYMSKSTIQRAIKHLKDEGLILAGNFNNDRFNHTNYYTLTEKGLSVVSNRIHRCSQNDHIESADLNTSIFNNNTDSTDINNSDSTLQIPLISPEEKLKLFFEEFWAVYPKKSNKKDAFKAFKSIKNIEQLLPTIIADVEMKAQTKDWQKENGQFIPYPGSYLRGERWNDVNEVAEKQAAINEAISDEINKFLF